MPGDRCGRPVVVERPGRPPQNGPAIVAADIRQLDMVPPGTNSCKMPLASDRPQSPFLGDGYKIGTRQLDLCDNEDSIVAPALDQGFGRQRRLVKTARGGTRACRTRWLLGVG